MDMLRAALSSVLGFDSLAHTYKNLRSSPAPLPESLLEFLKVSWRAVPKDLQHIPRTGAAVVVANHPFGILEAAVLLFVLRRIRPDVRVLANERLAGIAKLSDCVLPVNVDRADARNAVSMRQALRHLQQGGSLLVFPAGAVSHFQWRERTSTDPPWNPAVCRLVELATRSIKQCPVVPVFVPGSNSFLFHTAGIVHRDLRTALLAHELLNKKNTTVELRIGTPIPAARLLALPTLDERIDYVRWRTYLLAKREPYRTQSSKPLVRTAPQPLDSLIPPRELACEIDKLPAGCLLKRSSEYEVYLASAAQIPNVLADIGRLREITFRQVGEGTGHATDLDRFDRFYRHLFLWNARTSEVVGAYRLAGTDVTRDLYTQTLFHYDRRFLNKLGPALELGRSFVRAEYQKSFSPLLLLWQGIGAFIAANPRYKMLFGPVSISNQYQSASRDLMLSFLNRGATLAQWANLIRARNPPPRPRTNPLCSDIDDLADAVADLESTSKGVPVLLRQYLRLGGKLLGFTVDPAFSNSLDGLIVVDLTKTEPKLLPRYLGKEESARFLAFHRRESNHAIENIFDRELDPARSGRHRAAANAVL